MEQAARDKARAEQEKSEYEVRIVGHYFSSQPSRWCLSEQERWQR
jgi:hypothetical protein